MGRVRDFITAHTHESRKPARDESVTRAQVGLGFALKALGMDEVATAMWNALLVLTEDEEDFWPGPPDPTFDCVDMSGRRPTPPPPPPPAPTPAAAAPPPASPQPLPPPPPAPPPSAPPPPLPLPPAPQARTPPPTAPPTSQMCIQCF